MIKNILRSLIIILLFILLITFCGYCAYDLIDYTKFAEKLTDEFIKEYSTVIIGAKIVLLLISISLIFYTEYWTYKGVKGK